MVRVSVIVPTYNEADNVVEVIDRLRRALGGESHEIIVVDDDSPDGMWQRARRRGAGDPCVRVIRRIGRRGLASAVLDGMAAAEGDALAVIDGDLQHDESVLPEMVRSVLDDGADVCVGTRGGESGSFGDRARSRRWVTAAGAALARRVLPGLRRSSDPLSGFFVVSRRTCERAAPAINRNLREYKILWAFLARDRSLTVAEVGYEFRPRAGGRTKLSGPVLLDDLVNALALRLGPAVSPLFVKYWLVGVTGVAVSLAVYGLGARRPAHREPRRLRPRGARRPAHREPGHHPRPQPDLPVGPAGDPGRHHHELPGQQLLHLPRDRYRGWGLARGLLLFQAVSAVGVFVQLAVFQLLHRNGFPTASASSDVAAAVNNSIGLAVATLTNFLLNVSITWNRHRSTRSA